MWINPKTDWSKLDYYNPEELNRVENNINETLQLLKFFNDNATIQDCITDRDYSSIDYTDSLNRIESNIQALKDYFYEPIGWIPPKLNWTSNNDYKDSFSYVDANRLEKDIKILYELITEAKKNVQYCGMFNCGDDTRIF